MKLKAYLSILVAFSLALSSCDKKNALLVNRRTATPEKIEEIKKAKEQNNNHDKGVQQQQLQQAGPSVTSNPQGIRPNPAPAPVLNLSRLNNYINALPDAPDRAYHAKTTLFNTVSALACAISVISNPAAHANNKGSFNIAHDFTHSVDINNVDGFLSDVNEIAADTGVAAYFATIFAEYIVAEVVGDIDLSERSVNVNLGLNAADEVVRRAPPSPPPPPSTPPPKSPLTTPLPPPNLPT